jgi:hypothetical protein
MPPVAVGSGKLGTPWARMQREKLTPSCVASLWLGLEPPAPASLELLLDPDPHAPIRMPASTAAANENSGRATRVTPHVVQDDRLHRDNGALAAPVDAVEAGRRGGRPPGTESVASSWRPLGSYRLQLCDRTVGRDLASHVAREPLRVAREVRIGDGAAHGARDLGRAGFGRDADARSRWR